MYATFPSSLKTTLTDTTHTDGIVCMFAQFLLFPPLARRYGSLVCLRVVTFAFPVGYLLVPFTVLLPTSTSRQYAIFCVMLIKALAGVFAYPCSTILMTNSAQSIAVLGMLNGVAVSISAISRALGPWVAGTAFTWGVGVGYVIVPWWILSVFGVMGHLSTWWLVEMDGIRRAGVAEGEEEGIPLVGTDEDGEAANAFLNDHADAVRRMSFANGEDPELALHSDEDTRRSKKEVATTSSRTVHLAVGSGPPPRMRSPMRSRKDAHERVRSLD